MLSSIPLAFYFGAHVGQKDENSCRFHYSKSEPIAILAHELIHALNATSHIPKAPNLIIEETRAYLFDRLVACSLAEGDDICCPLKFYQWKYPPPIWVWKIPDQLARVVADNAVRNEFGGRVCLSEKGKNSLGEYSAWVRKIMFNPKLLSAISMATERELRKDDVDGESH